MEYNIQQETYRVLFLTNLGLNITVVASEPNKTTIQVKDPDLKVTYDVADFDGSKYVIKHFNKFNDIFIKTAKVRPQLIRDLLKFHHENNKTNDTLNDLRIRFYCFKRRVSIYIKRKILK